MLTINDTIWLSVTDEAKMPIATNTLAKNNNPMYEPQIAPISKFPFGLPSS